MQRMSELASEHVSTLREELDTFGIHVIEARSPREVTGDGGELRAVATCALARMMRRQLQPIPIRTAG